MSKSKRGSGVFKRSNAKLIALPIVAVICVVVIVLANYYLNYYKSLLYRVFGGDGVSVSASATELVEADKVVRRTAEESMVLLYNDQGFLPKRDIKKVNLFGWGSTDSGFLLTGGGSGGATILDTDRNGNKRTKLDLNDAFKEAGIEYNTTLYNAYKDFSSFDADYRKTGTTGANVVESLKNPGASWYTEKRMTQAKQYSDVAVAVISRWGAENASHSELRSVGGYSDGKFLELTKEELAMFDALEANGFNVIVVLNVCNNIELGFIEDYDCIKACIFAGIPGQSGAIAIPEIIKGTVNPSGRISDTLPYDYQTNDPTYVNAVKSGNDIVYQEGIYFGYKWYETADVEKYFNEVDNRFGTGYDGVVQFPFGYGLSYTTFKWTTDFSNVTSLTADGKYEVKVKVENTGSVAGRDVVQLYGHAPYVNGKVEKAERVLLDFAKTSLLEAGQSETVTLSFSAYDLASYDEYDKNANNHTGYELDAGEYRIEVMQNAHEYKNAEPTEGDTGDYKRVNLASAILFDNDPTTGKKVENLFTGANAYAGCPIDGNSNISYLSREDGFANFPQSAAARSGNVPTLDQIKAASKARYDETKVNAKVQYGKNASMFLVGTKKSDGNIDRVSLDTLSGEGDSAVTLSYNTYILEFLMEDTDSSLWESFLNQVTREETKNLIGRGGFQTIALYSLGKPRCVDKDGPAGFNNSVDDALEAKSDQYTLFCSESLAGCGFSKEIAYAIGEAQAKIGNSVGFQGWYGPGVNLHRSVYNSRNYEYYSEDAVLSGKLAAGTIKGAYDNNMYCYLKHFAVSEAGFNAKNLNTWLTEQSLRESYLRPFEIAVKEGKANAIMSAFNRVGGVLSGYNYALLTDVLRDEWGFKGSVITDWYMGNDGYMSDYEAGVLAGNNLWLAGTSPEEANINLDDKYVAYAARQSVKGIMYTFIDTNLTASDIKINPAPRSALVVTVWVLINVVFGLGIAACIVFTVLPFTRKPKPETVDGGKGGAPADVDGATESADGIASSDSGNVDIADAEGHSEDTADADAKDEVSEENLSQTAETAAVSDETIAEAVEPDTAESPEISAKEPVTGDEHKEAETVASEKADETAAADQNVKEQESSEKQPVKRASTKQSSGAKTSAAAKKPTASKSSAKSTATGAAKSSTAKSTAAAKSKSTTTKSTASKTATAKSTASKTSTAKSNSGKSTAKKASQNNDGASSSEDKASD